MADIPVMVAFDLDNDEGPNRIGLGLLLATLGLFRFTPKGERYPDTTVVGALDGRRFKGSTKDIADDLRSEMQRVDGVIVTKLCVALRNTTLPVGVISDETDEDAADFERTLAGRDIRNVEAEYGTPFLRPE